MVLRALHALQVLSVILGLGLKTANSAHVASTRQRWPRLLWTRVKIVLPANMLRARATMRRQTVCCAPLANTSSKQGSAQMSAWIVQQERTLPRKVTPWPLTASSAPAARTRQGWPRPPSTRARSVWLASMRQTRATLPKQTACGVQQANTWSQLASALHVVIARPAPFHRPQAHLQRPHVKPAL